MSMSNPSNQLSQYKDAVKLLKKKCQSLESQLSGIFVISESLFVESKTAADTSRLLLLAFLEYISSPFSGNLRAL